jgi:hypothetical protein
MEAKITKIEEMKNTNLKKQAKLSRMNISFKEV